MQSTAQGGCTFHHFPSVSAICFCVFGKLFILWPAQISSFSNNISIIPQELIISLLPLPLSLPPPLFLPLSLLSFCSLSFLKVFVCDIFIVVIKSHLFLVISPYLQPHYSKSNTFFIFISPLTSIKTRKAQYGTP